MGKQIRIGIVGYGNIGKAVELVLGQNPDMVLAGIFTRRDPAGIVTKSGITKVFSLSEAEQQIF